MSEEQDRVVIRDNRKIDPVTGEARKPAPAGTPDVRGAAQETPQTPDATAETAGDVAGGQLVDAALLDERTADLQRLQAEYANYRRRADRERLAAGDLAVGRVLAELLPVVDDLDRARAHGDLSGPLKAVADKLESVFARVGLVAFGAVGDPFDPAMHEAVLHDESDTVTVPTCTTVMRQGFRHGDRLLRPAMVGVTDPLVFARAATAEQPEPTDQAGDGPSAAGASTDAHGRTPDDRGAGGAHGDALQAAVDAAADKQ